MGGGDARENPPEARTAAAAAAAGLLALSGHGGSRLVGQLSPVSVQVSVPVPDIRTINAQIG